MDQKPASQSNAVTTEDVIETTIGKLSGRTYYRVAGVDMGWCVSPEEASNVAERVRNWCAAYFGKKKDH